MIKENEKPPQIRVQLSPQPCHVSFINQEHALIGCKNGQVYRSMVILIKSYEALESLFRKFLEIELGLRARQAC